MIKKMISLMILISILISFYIPAMTKDQEEQFSVEVEFLQKAGILDKTFNNEKEITKAEFAALLIKMIHPNSDFSESGWLREKLFQDVDVDHKFYSYIKACKDLGIISGDQNHYFYPDHFLSIAESITMIINAIGYTPYALAYGGYPTGYYKIAQETGILKGIVADNSKNITGKICAKILYNALFADLLTVNQISNGEIAIKPQQDNNILAARFGILEYDAIVVDNGITSLIEKSTLETDKVILKVGEDKIISAYTNNTGIEQYLGSRIRAFIKNNEETGRNEVVYFSLHKSCKEVIISSESIIQVTEQFIEYEPDKNNDTSVKLKFENNAPIVIYNGVHVSNYNSNLLKPESGILRLIDNDGNGSYNIIDILSFQNQNNKTRNIVVDSVDLEKNYIYCKFNPAQMNLNLDSSDAFYRFLYYDEIKSLGDLKENDIISVAQSEKLIDGKKIYYLVAKRQQVKGKINSASSENGEIYLDNDAYKISSSILKTKSNFINNLSFNIEMTFHLDAVGHIAYISGYKMKGQNYGYLIHATIKSQGDDLVLIKLFTKSGEIKQLYFSNKVNIDGTVRNGAVDQFNEIIKRPAALKKPDGAPKDNEYMSRPIIYETNSDGYIVKIDTDNPNKDVIDSENLSKETVFKGNLYSTQTNIGYSEEEVSQDDALKAAYRSTRLAIINGNNVDGMFYINSNTVIMSVPDIDTNGLGDSNDLLKTLSDKQSASYKYAINYSLVKKYENPISNENYKILSFNQLSKSVNYDIQAYDLDLDTGIANFVIIRGRTDSLAYGKVPYTGDYPMYAFLRLSRIYDAQTNKSLLKLYYTQYGDEELSVLVDEDNLNFIYQAIIFGCKDLDTPFNIKTLALKCGDLIRVMRSGDYLTHIERVYRIDEVSNTYSSMYYPSINYNAYSTTGVTSFPYDVRQTWAPHVDDGYRIRTVYPKSISGNTLISYMGFPTPSTIDFKDKTTYSILYYDISDAQIILINKYENGDVKVKFGEISDIVTTDQVGGLDGASILMCRCQNGKTTQIFVLNHIKGEA